MQRHCRCGGAVHRLRTPTPVPSTAVTESPYLIGRRGFEVRPASQFAMPRLLFVAESIRHRGEVAARTTVAVSPNYGLPSRSAKRWSGRHDAAGPFKGQWLQFVTSDRRTDRATGRDASYGSTRSQQAVVSFIARRIYRGRPKRSARGTTEDKGHTLSGSHVNLQSCAGPVLVWRESETTASGRHRVRMRDVSIHADGA